MNDKTIITITGIGSIVVLEVVALFNGIDGALFGLVIAAISGLAGYQLKASKDNGQRNA